MGGSTLKSWACMASSRLDYWQTSCWNSSWWHEASTNANLLQGCGDIWKPIIFVVVVDDFGVKYEGKQNANHLVDKLTNHYEISIDWAGKLFCGVSLNWDYTNRWVNFAMPEYITKMLLCFQHAQPWQPQHAPHCHEHIMFGKNAQTAPVDNSNLLSLEKIKQLQRIVIILLYYFHAVDPTMAAAFSSTAAWLRMSFLLPTNF